MPTTAATTAESFRLFRETFRSAGIRPALAILLEMTDYRYIGVWRFHEGRAAAAVHYDRADPTQESALEVPETATYCTLVRDEAAPVCIADAGADSRLEGHPAREAVLAYCGVPLMDSNGAILGTLCHYDVVARDPEQINVELMLMVASHLVQGGHVPPYPAKVPGNA